MLAEKLDILPEIVLIIKDTHQKNTPKPKVKDIILLSKMKRPQRQKSINGREMRPWKAESGITKTASAMNAVGIERLPRKSKSSTILSKVRYLQVPILSLAQVLRVRVITNIEKDNQSAKISATKEAKETNMISTNIAKRKTNKRNATIPHPVLD